MVPRVGGAVEDVEDVFIASTTACIVESVTAVVRSTHWKPSQNLFGN